MFALGKAGRLEAARAIFDEAHPPAAWPRARLRCALYARCRLYVVCQVYVVCRTCRQRGCNALTVEWLVQMDVPPDAVTYNTLVDSLGKVITSATSAPGLCRPLPPCLHRDCAHPSMPRPMQAGSTLSAPRHVLQLLNHVVLRCAWLSYAWLYYVTPGCTTSSHGRTRTILPCSTVRAQAGRVDEALQLYQRMARER